MRQTKVTGNDDERSKNGKFCTFLHSEHGNQRGKVPEDMERQSHHTLPENTENSPEQSWQILAMFRRSEKFSNILFLLALLSFVLHGLERILSGHGLDYIFYPVHGLQENTYLEELFTLAFMMVCLLLGGIFLAIRSQRRRFRIWLSREKRSKRRRGKRNGERIEYSWWGHFKMKRRYRQGKLHGEAKEYYHNGRRKAVRQYAEGKLHGELREYYAHGQLKAMKHYQYGKLDGRVKEYDEHGNLLLQRVYTKGKLQHTRPYDSA